LCRVVNRIGTPQQGVQNQTIEKQLKAFGANLRRERVAAKMTQEKLAEESDLNPRTIQKIEAGETNILITTALRLCRALNCSSTKLLDGLP